MAAHIFLLCAMWLALATGQRPGFAGSRPIGFPEVYNRTTTEAAGLGDRFGEGDVTTQRLPIEANGDRELVDRLSKLPVDKQPFWFINWQALEANRNKPQTYPQKPNDFIDFVPNSGSKTPNLNILNSKMKPSDGQSSVGATTGNFIGSESVTVGQSSTEPNQAINNRFYSNTEIKNRLSETESTSKSPTTENRKVGLTEGFPTASVLSETSIDYPRTPTMHIPTHSSFRQTWLLYSSPRNPIID